MKKLLFLVSLILSANSFAQKTKNKGTINLRVNDLFKGMKFAFNSSSPFIQNGKFHWESQTAYIGFNYKFGQGKNKAKQRRQRDDNIKESGAGF